jgi:hypothetical protein
MGEALGQGEFGMVVRAMWEDEQNRKSTPVAVKTIKGRWSRVGEGVVKGGGGGVAEFSLARIPTELHFFCFQILSKT